MLHFQEEFIGNCHYRMEESLRMIEICFGKLSEEQVWAKPNAASNSIGNLILHLCGNMRQYAISGLGNFPDYRKRDLEFSQNGGLSKTQLLDKLKSTVAEVKETTRQSTPENWLTTKQVQGFEFTGVGLVLHVVEHLSYHTGQIALITKLFLEAPLGFYDGINLNIINE